MRLSTVGSLEAALFRVSLKQRDNEKDGASRPSQIMNESIHPENYERADIDS